HGFSLPRWMWLLDAGRSRGLVGGRRRHAKTLRFVLVAQMRLQCVKRDVENLAGASLVTLAALEDQPDIAAAPRPKRIVAIRHFQEQMAVILRDLARQIRDRDCRARRQSNSPLEYAFELTHISRPVVGGQRFERGQRHRALALSLVLAEEVRHERR